MSEYWYCEKCTEEVDPSCVTYQELHDRCGHPVVWIVHEDSPPTIEPAAYDRERLDSFFENLERVEDGRFAVYRVSDEHGHDAGLITCMSGSEIRVYVDNFPGQKKYFSSNYPVPTIEQFEADIKRTGLKLVRANT